MSFSISSISFTIKNWDEFNPKKTTKKTSWFRCENDIVDNPLFSSLTGDEFKCAIYFLGRASAQNDGSGSFTFHHAKLRGMEPEVLLEALRKLEAVGFLKILGAAGRPEDPAGAQKIPEDPVGSPGNGQEQLGALSKEKLREEKISEVVEEPKAKPKIDLSQLPEHYQKHADLFAAMSPEDEAGFEHSFSLFQPVVRATFWGRRKEIKRKFGEMEHFYAWGTMLVEGKGYKALPDESAQARYFIKSLSDELKVRKAP